MTKIEQSIEVNVPVHAAYRQMTQFEDYPRFMEGVHKVQKVDAHHLHWRAEQEGEEMEWDAEITEQVPDQRIVWRNTSGPKNEGKVTFEQVQPDKTRVTLSMKLDDSHHKGAGKKSAAEKEASEKSMTERTGQDLVRFKKILEHQPKKTEATKKEADAHAPEETHATQSFRHKEDNRQLSHEKEQDDEAMHARAGQRAHLERSGEKYELRQSVREEPTAAKPRRVEHKEHKEPKEQVPDMKSLMPQAWFPNFLHIWNEPFSMMRRMTEEMDHFFDRFVTRPTAKLGQQMQQQVQQQVQQVSSQSLEWRPQVEVSQHDNRVVIFADLPGMKREDVLVEINQNRLTIEGERPEKEAQAGAQSEQNYRHSERNYGHFYREIPLPEGVDPDAAEASMHDGVLEVTVPLPPSRQQGRRLDIGHAQQDQRSR